MKNSQIIQHPLTSIDHLYQIWSNLVTFYFWLYTVKNVVVFGGRFLSFFIICNRMCSFLVEFAHGLLDNNVIEFGQT